MNCQVTMTGFVINCDNSFLYIEKPFVGCEKEHVKACEKSQQLEVT